MRFYQCSPRKINNKIIDFVIKEVRDVITLKFCYYFNKEMLKKRVAQAIHASTFSIVFSSICSFSFSINVVIRH